MTTRRGAMALGLAGACIWASPGRAQDNAGRFPAKAIRLVAPFPPGAPFDALARKLAEAMAARFGVPVLVDNKPGAAGSLGASETARAPADGYTLLITMSDPLVTTPATLKVPYDPQRDFAPIGKIASSAPVLMVNASLKSTSLRELVEEAKAAKQPLSYGSFGPASFPQLVMESFGRKAGIRLTEVPYRGVPPAVQDLLGNQINLAFSSPAHAAQLLPQGKVRVLAAMGSSRSPVLPNVPTFGESGFDSAFARRVSWLGLLGPAGLPATIVRKVGDTMRALVREPDFASWLGSMDFAVIAGSPEQFRAELDAELHTVTRFIREELKIEPGELQR